MEWRLAELVGVQALARDRARANGRSVPSHQAIAHRGIRLAKLIRGLGIPNRPPDPSDDEILILLVQACREIGLGGLSRVLYKRWRTEHLDAPSLPGLAERFGSWSGALESAGVPQIYGNRRFSDVELLAAIREAANSIGVDPQALTTSVYEWWQAQHGGPKAITITKRFKRWSIARQTAQSTAVASAAPMAGV